MAVSFKFKSDVASEAVLRGIDNVYRNLQEPLSEVAAFGKQIVVGVAARSKIAVQTKMAADLAINQFETNLAPLEKYAAFMAIQLVNTSPLDFFKQKTKQANGKLAKTEEPITSPLSLAKLNVAYANFCTSLFAAYSYADLAQLENASTFKNNLLCAFDPTAKVKPTHEQFEGMALLLRKAWKP